MKYYVNPRICHLLRNTSELRKDICIDAFTGHLVFKASAFQIHDIRPAQICFCFHSILSCRNAALNYLELHGSYYQHPLVLKSVLAEAKVTLNTI